MTAKMLLHWSPRSPFVRKVMIAAHELGLSDRLETVRTVVAASQPNIELMKQNPQSRLPTLGQCTFADYFTAAIGDTLYQKFMANYTWKMWNIPGNELQTSMVWADRFHHAQQPGAGQHRL